MAVTIGYIGATGRDIGYGGTHETTCCDQHQPDRSGRSRGRCSRSAAAGIAAALRESVPNPFFGIAGAGEFGTRATISRGQLLRPFPQFGDVLDVREDRRGRSGSITPRSFMLDKRYGARAGGAAASATR